ncbi:MAG: right-handed parallel beta-helix repeat-containing protein [Methanophagales archaeon]|nr:right-handed parallel beta-helix repeat-containing protein [Methanophagales archaeon]
MNIRIRKCEKAVVFAVLVATLACVSIGTASAATHDVYPGNHAIQMAIYNATAGDTIIVHDGTYNESISVDNRLTIKSENGADYTFIHAVSEYGCRISTDHVNLIGFTIEEATDVCGIVVVEANDCNISNNNVSGNYQGISLFNASRNTIYNNDVLANERWGISLNYSSSHNQITYNNVSNSWDGNGIYLTNNSNYNTITDNDVSSNNYNGISLRTSNNNEIQNNVANANQGTGIALWYSSENIIEDNKAKTNTYMGIYLENSVNNHIKDNNASNNGRDGFRLWNDSSSNSISGNAAGNNNWSGIVLSSSSDNTISGNDAGNNNEDGIAIIDSSNSISGNTISNNKDGISLEASSNNTISSNTLSNNGDGISLLDSSNNDISGNTFTNGGLVVSFAYKNVVNDNTVNGKPLVYLEKTSDKKVTNAGQVILVNCTNISVEDLDLSNTSVGIELWKTESSRIRNNKVSNNNRYGIYLKDYSNNNIITGNKACRNSDGICITYSGNNIISGNNVCNNDGVGIDFDYSSSSNNIYLNNFINNTDNVNSINVDSVASTNTWNLPSGITYTYNGTTYESYLGNYWDDYEGTDADGDGIGNTPYSIDSKEDESDDYPLMMPFENYLT